MKINNEQKAKEIVSKKPFSTSISPIYKDYAYDSVMEMAEWKDKQSTEEKKQWIDKAAKWFEDNFKDWFEEEMMSNIIIEFKKQLSLLMYLMLLGI